jgi:hypothetical protein
MEGATMQVFGFDLLPYPEHMGHLKVNGELPYPLPKRYFHPDIAVRNDRDRLDAWVLMEELGFDGIGFNEHHTSPYGLMTSPNLMAAAASQRTHRAKLLIYGNLSPIRAITVPIPQWQGQGIDRANAQLLPWPSRANDRCNKIGEVPYDPHTGTRH